MGKVKKVRQKYHLSLKKSKSLSNLSEVGDSKETQPKENLFKSTENIFAGVDISWDDITKSLPKDFDARSVISTKSRKELKEEERHLKKKEKQKLRHERFMQKLDFSHQLMKQSKSKSKSKSKKKKKNPDTSDMKSLLEALPSLETLAAESSKKKHEKNKTKPRGTLKAKKRLRQQTYDTKLFKKILEDKIFKQNPLLAINQYLKQKVQMET